MDSERTVATALADYLRQAGVTHVFGYPGESVVDFMEATRQAGPATVAAVREASAAFMAEGAAMRTGRIGVCLSTLRRRCRPPSPGAAGRWSSMPGWTPRSTRRS